MTFKQKKGAKNERSKYLKPGALAQLRYSRTVTKSCRVFGKKRVTSSSVTKSVNILKAEAATLSVSRSASPTPSKIGDKPVGTPKTPQAMHCDSDSRLESLPLDLLVKIMCHLHHDQLRASFHVSQRIRAAVSIAREWHFNYTTPDRSRQELLKTKTPLPTEHWPFARGDSRGVCISKPQTPKAPRQGPRTSRLHPNEITQIAAVLFRDSSIPSRCINVPPRLPKALMKPLGSNRVLFYEDELCQAVQQNKLR